MYLYTDLTMMQAILQSVVDSFTDALQSPLSLIIFLFLTTLIIVLIIASLFPSWRLFLVKIRLLEEDERPSSMLAWFVTTIVIIKIIQACLVQPFIVDGGSMLPTFHNAEFLLVDKLSYLINKPERGDVVIFKFYEGATNAYAGKYLIKRAIGLPGDRVVVKQGVTTIYNQENPTGLVLDESYVTYKDETKNADVTLDDHHYFVMGDNRAQSYDSRSWGGLDVTQVKGQVLMRVYPFASFSYEPGRHQYTK